MVDKKRNNCLLDKPLLQLAKKRLIVEFKFTELLSSRFFSPLNTPMKLR